MPSSLVTDLDTVFDRLLFEPTNQHVVLAFLIDVLSWARLLQRLRSEEWAERLGTDPLLDDAHQDLRALALDRVAAERLAESRAEAVRMDAERRQELRRNIEQLCFGFGVVLGPEQRETLNQATLEVLRDLLVAVARQRTWPED